MPALVNKSIGSQPSTNTSPLCAKRAEAGLKQREKANHVHFKTQKAKNSMNSSACYGPILHNFSQIAMLPSQTTPIQPKLRINQPGDKYEQEADRVAEQVIRMPELGSGGISNIEGKIQRKCTSCEKEEGEEEEIQMKPLATRVSPIIQTKSENGELSTTSSFQNQLNSSKGCGSAMPSATNYFMSSAFGSDFSHVRFHADSRAHQMNKDIHAKAFTHGSDIYFSNGAYNPTTYSGIRLMAHELTHIIQQQGIKGRWNTSKRSVIQRQTIPIPEFDELDPCLIIPPGLPSPLDKLSGQKACGSHVKKLREILRGHKKRRDKSLCPPLFKPGTATGYKDKCCNEFTNIHNEQNCCNPYQANWYYGTCCPSDTLYNPTTKQCEKIKLPILPPIKVPGTITNPPAKPPTKKSTPQVMSVEIRFKFDRPKVNEVGNLQTLNSDGQKVFNNLIKQLTSDKNLKVQLIGSASPMGTDEYNKELGERRARTIAKMMLSAGMNSSRIAQTTQITIPAGCDKVDQGIYTCGEIGAVDENDQKVTVYIF